MGERLMSSNNTDQLLWPYLFCSKCKKLSPVRTDDMGMDICMNCTSFCAGPRVIFSSDEARVRKLTVLRKKTKE